MSNCLRKYKNITPTLGSHVYIDPQACVIGSVTLGNDVSIWPMTVLRGDVNYIEVGDRTNVQDGSVLHVHREADGKTGGYPLIIGKDVTVGHKAVLHGCTIADEVLIGMGAIVLDGAIIESHVIVAAGALVPPRRTLQSGYVYAGNPAKPLRALTERETSFFVQSAANYVRLKDEFRMEFIPDRN